MKGASLWDEASAGLNKPKTPPATIAAITHAIATSTSCRVLARSVDWRIPSLLLSYHPKRCPDQLASRIRLTSSSRSHRPHELGTARSRLLTTRDRTSSIDSTDSLLRDQVLHAADGNARTFPTYTENGMLVAKLDPRQALPFVI